MSEYITGSPEDLSNFTHQMDFLFRRRGLIIAGSIGRAAMYSHYRYPVEPLPLRTFEGGPLRDIDLLRGGHPRKPIDINCGWNNFVRGPHKHDNELSELFGYMGPGDPPTLLDDAVLDKALFTRVTRDLDGIPVRTYTVGTHLALEHYFTTSIGAPYRDKVTRMPKSPTPLEVFQEFAEEVRPQHPEEFLPDEFYAPFYEYEE